MKLPLAFLVLAIAVAASLAGYFQGASKVTAEWAQATQETHRLRMKCWNETPGAKGCVEAGAFVSFQEAPR